MKAIFSVIVVITIIFANWLNKSGTDINKKTSYKNNSKKIRDIKLKRPTSSYERFKKNSKNGTVSSKPVPKTFYNTITKQEPNESESKPEVPEETKITPTPVKMTDNSALLKKYNIKKSSSDEYEVIIRETLKSRQFKEEKFIYRSDYYEKDWYDNISDLSLVLTKILCEKK